VQPETQRRLAFPAMGRGHLPALVIVAVVHATIVFFSFFPTFFLRDTTPFLRGQSFFYFVHRQCITITSTVSPTGGALEFGFFLF
jgi:hypothetical protein